MMPEFIFGDGKKNSRSGWIWSISSSGIKLSFVLSYNSSWSISFFSLFYVSCSCVSIMLVCSLWFFIWRIWLYGSSKRTDFAFGLWQRIVAGGGPVFINVSLFFLNSFGLDLCLWLIWISCSLGAFEYMYNGPLKGKYSSVP